MNGTTFVKRVSDGAVFIASHPPSLLQSYARYHLWYFKRVILRKKKWWKPWVSWRVTDEVWETHDPNTFDVLNTKDLNQYAK